MRARPLVRHACWTVDMGISDAVDEVESRVARRLTKLGTLPGLKAAEIDGRLEAAGIDKVYVFCVNDGAVMKAWKKVRASLDPDGDRFVGSDGKERVL